MSDIGDLDIITALDAEDVLEACLNEDDLEVISGATKDLGSMIRWGKVVEKVLPELYEQMEDLLTGGGEFPGRYYLKGKLWGKVLDEDVEDFEDEAPRSLPRRQMLTLKLLRKLLVVMKTKIDRQIDGIPRLSSNEEGDLFDIIRVHDGRFGDMELSEEEVLEVGDRGHRLLTAGAMVESGDCGHGRTVCQRSWEGGTAWMEFHCLDCDITYKRVMVKSYSQEPQPCWHDGSVIWRPGQEGKVAECRVCKEEMPHPEQYDWVGAGLEPCGDDPEEDEVISLCSAY